MARSTCLWRFDFVSQQIYVCVKNTSVAYLTMHVECFVWRPRAFAVVHCGMWGVVSMDTR